MKQSQSALNQTVAAKKLGVSREHLNRVLRGRRNSRRLMTRYNQLLKNQK